jgi:mannosyltransferase OCH1-like enzyme
VYFFLYSFDYFLILQICVTRVRITYHFGIIYMDLDFYCYFSFECLENYLVCQIHSEEKLFVGNPQEASIVSSVSSGGYNKTHYLSSDILIVSREPELHSQFIHHRSRVVIQDFFFATPKHPFLRRFLETINTQFKEEMLTTKVPSVINPLSSRCL